MRKRRGRPALIEGQHGQPATTWLTEQDYDQICRIAQREQVSVARVLRVAAIRLLRDERGELVRL